MNKKDDSKPLEDEEEEADDEPMVECPLVCRVYEAQHGTGKLKSTPERVESQAEKDRDSEEEEAADVAALGFVGGSYNSPLCEGLKTLSEPKNVEEIKRFLV